MIALFFEVTPHEGQQDRYLEIAGALRPELDASGGVLYLDRFRNLARPATMLSHQIWADEASLARWRANGCHYGAQIAGRREVFEDYRLRVGVVIASRIEAGRVNAVRSDIFYNDPDRTAERWMIVACSKGKPCDGLDEGETWRSVYDDTVFAKVASLPGLIEGLSKVQVLARDTCVSAAHLVLVSRDYGLFDRREAPQYFPSANGS